MTQSNGLSPRTPRHQRQQQSPSESSKGKSVTIDKKRFFQEPMAAVAAGMEGPRSAWKAHSRPRSPTLPLVSPRQQLPVYPRGSFSKLRAAAVHQKPMARSTMRLLATIAIVCSVVPWVCTRGLSGFGGSLAMEDPTVPVTARTSFRGLARAELGNSKRQHGSVPTEHRCQSKAWADSMTADRGMCASLLPLSVVEADGWLVAVHVDRHPSVAPAGVAGKTTLRGATKRSTHRDLPHQYFVRTMEATLHSIAAADPGAHVDVALFSEGRWGGIVDEMGVPVDWDVPHEICGDLGLHCTQAFVELNEPTSIPDVLECIAAADVYVSSESDVSQAAAVLSTGVKVLTDRWDMDEDETMVALNPATTVAGMPKAQREGLRNVVGDWYQCSRNKAVALKRP